MSRGPFLGSNSSFQFTGNAFMPLTMAGWGYIDATAGGLRTMMSSANSGSAVYAMIGITTGAVAVATSSNAGAATATTVAAASASSWFHLAGTFPGGGAGRSIFLNGANKVTEATVKTIGGDACAVGALNQPSVPSIGSYWSNGLLAELGWWNVILTDEEIAALAAGMSPLLVRPDSLTHYLPLLGQTAEPNIMAGATSLVGSVAVGDHHPRIIRPKRKLIL